MHRQLHHDTNIVDLSNLNATKPSKEKSKTVPKATSNMQNSSSKDVKNFKVPARTSSATRLFEKLRSRICKSKILFSHPEEKHVYSNMNDLYTPSECTSKALNADYLSRCSGVTTTIQEVSKETYGCHLCTFDADRITVLDRHLLNDHKIGLDTLLKLVMTKTKDGLNEEPPTVLYGIRQPYYKAQDEIFEEGEFVVETVTPKIKILKHTSTNTDIKWVDILDLKNNCGLITEDLDNLTNPTQCNKDDFVNKMQTLNECMCKFVDSSNMIKKVLTKEFDSKSARERSHEKEPIFDLGLGDSDTTREWNRPQSEKMEKNRDKHRDNRRDSSKLPTKSFYF